MKVNVILKAAAPFLFVTALSLAPLFAHHSFSAEFDGTKPVEMKGVVTRVDWENPHVYFYVDVKDEKGNVVNWGCETGGPGGLRRAGWTRESMKPGDHVTIDGYLAKDGSHLMDARNVTLPNGRKVFVGTPGDGGPTK
ncbi:MAG TPA: DUF6152 family protein [Bryobacteraceae bacterium]|nr:DUF6152 family protein [Bryobacteraceae bacterium]